ncbi:MAG: putative serine/threonine protein kinase, partial [Streblomastix strix]
VYEAYSLEDGMVAVKIFQKEKYNQSEINIGTGVLRFVNWGKFPFLEMEYANMKTLDIIAKQPQIPLPSYTLRALMKQILEGMRAFHSADLVHRDIKCDNILLHSPPGSGRVYAKISDFGFAKKVDFINQQTYLAGTLPFMSPEQFHENPIITQKVDIYALGITFYKLIAHKYPVNERNIKEQTKKMTQLKSIDRPFEIKDNILWDLLSKLLEFNPNKRITAEQALQHPYFTSPEAIADISKEQQDLASLSAVAESEGDSSISEFDKDPTFIVSESNLKKKN